MAKYRAVYEKIESQKQFCEIDGAHFGLLWYPCNLFDEAIDRQTEFLRKTMLNT